MEERRLAHIFSHLSPSSRFPLREANLKHGSSREELVGESNSRYIFGLSTHGNRRIPLAVQNSARSGTLAFGCNDSNEHLNFKKSLETETGPYLPHITLPQVSMNESSAMELSLSCNELTVNRCRSSSMGPHLATTSIAQNSCICKIHEENQRSHLNDAGKGIDSKVRNVSSSEIEINKIEELQTGLDEQNRSQSASQNEVDVHRLESEAISGMERKGSERMIVSRNNVMTGERRSFVEDCIFCLIIQGRSPAFKLYEDDICICILDVHPITHGHSLIIPKTHFPSLELTLPEVAAAMCAIVPFISVAIMEATNCDSFNLIVNSGKAAGQVVFHTHFHIIPRRQGDNLWRSESACRSTLCLNHETSSLVQQIRHKLSGKGS